MLEKEIKEIIRLFLNLDDEAKVLVVALCKYLQSQNVHHHPC